MLKRNDVIDRLASRGYTKKNANLILDDVIGVIMEAMAEGEDVQLYGFGTFCVKEVSGRDTLDFQTRERIHIPGHKAPKFAPSATLKRCVREGVVRD